MELRHLEYFVAVVDHGGVSRAAEALHVAQPTISQGLRVLDRELNADLFVRTGRRLTPSPAG
ncbi:MAG: LysR family transcriptional regulator, partial [Kocuria sp.]|nr:LysR family transcriptional regulator [Kocuria sp.]